MTTINQANWTLERKIGGEVVYHENNDMNCNDARKVSRGRSIRTLPTQTLREVTDWLIDANMITTNPEKRQEMCHAIWQAFN